MLHFCAIVRILMPISGEIQSNDFSTPFECLDLSPDSTTLGALCDGCPMSPSQVDCVPRLAGEEIKQNRETINNQQVTIDDQAERIEVADRKSEELGRLAVFDDLTGVRNRWGFRTAAQSKLVQRGRRSSDGVVNSVVYFDADGFKPINDTGGHALGDLVLKHVASCLAETVRQEDLAGRLGGDEFAAFLDNTRIPDAIIFAWRLQKALRVRRMMDFEGRNILVPTVTVSIGIAEVSESDHFKLAIEQADAAMYLSKRAGPGNVSHSALNPGFTSNGDLVYATPTLVESVMPWSSSKTKADWLRAQQDAP